MDTAWIYVLFWLVEAALCGIVASNKGRNVPLWVILGLLAGFFALIVLAFMPNLKRRAAAAVTQGTRECHHCASPIPQHATVCRFCSRET